MKEIINIERKGICYRSGDISRVFGACNLRNSLYTSPGTYACVSACANFTFITNNYAEPWSKSTVEREKILKHG